MVYTLPPNTLQAERTTRSTIETHTSSSRAHICTLLDRIDTILLYHTAHLPISIPETTRMFVDRNPHAYIMWTFQLPIENRPFFYHPLAP